MKVVRNCKACGLLDLAAQLESLDDHVVAVDREFPRSSHNFVQSAICDTNGVAPATRRLVVTNNDERALSAWVLEPAGKRLASALAVNCIHAPRSSSRVSHPAIFRQDSSHEFGFARAACTSRIYNESHAALSTADLRLRH